VAAGQCGQHTPAATAALQTLQLPLPQRHQGDLTACEGRVKEHEHGDEDELALQGSHVGSHLTLVEDGSTFTIPTPLSMTLDP